MCIFVTQYININLPKHLSVDAQYISINLPKQLSVL